MPKERYYQFNLYAEKDGKACEVEKLPQVIQDKNNPLKYNSMPIVGIYGEEGLVEFSTGLPVAERPCRGLSWTTRKELSRGEFLKIVRDISEEDKCRILERIYSIHAGRQKSSNSK